MTWDVHRDAAAWSAPQHESVRPPFPVPDSEVLGPMSESIAVPDTVSVPGGRLHHLDALRAFAMLLGIALHASCSLAPLPWLVQDSRQDPAFGTFLLGVHGFRMPLFFLVSGFFTAMLWRRRGIAAMLRQRTLRIFVPCMLGLVTIIPLTMGVSIWAMFSPSGPFRDDGTLIGAIRTGDRAAFEQRLKDGADVNAPDETLSVRPLNWAALRGDDAVARLLIEHGADVNGRNGDGSTPLHSAAFLGHPDVAELLLANGADPQARMNSGETPFKSVEADWGFTQFVAFQVLRLPPRQEAEVKAGRAKVRSLIEQRIASGGSTPSQSAEANRSEKRMGLVASYRDFLTSDRFQVNLGGWKFHLVETPVFSHLWFLWFLCWLVPLFALVAWSVDRLGGARAPGWLTLSPLRLLWVVPVTLIAEFFMGYGGPHFGADTATGLILPPHLLLYYGIFFGFGALYYDADDDQGQLGRTWWLWLPAALALILPVGLATMTNRPLGGIVQVLYTWVMSFGLIGLFRRYLSRPSPAARYVSDSSYWLYLVHLPLVIALQMIVRDWPLPALVKFVLICAVTTGVLLLSYELMVRHSWIGLLLNGRKVPRSRRPAEEPAAPVLSSPTLNEPIG
jgi:peptidoglycan/LPS O-acetylase OafA/YrhL